MEENNNAIESNQKVESLTLYEKLKKVESWYEILKLVSKTHLNIKIVVDELPEGQHLKTRKGSGGSIDIVTVDKNHTVYENVHWVLGLMISLYCKQRKPKIKLSTNDLNFIGDQLWYKYGGDTLRGDTPKNVYMANKVLENFIKMIDEAK